MSEIPETGTSLDRRRLLGRTAAAGLLAVPGVSLLSGCLGSGDDDTPDQAEGEKSGTNPLGVKDDAALEVIIFNGGLGTKYATDVHIPSYKKSFPKANVKFSQAEEISTVVQPRFAGGTPPDMVNNAGSKLMDMGALVADGQAADLTDLFAAPSFDIPGKTVAETLVPGAIEQGTYDVEGGRKPFAVNYSFTVFGLYYNKKLFDKNSWTVPTTWADFTALCDKIKAAGIVPFAYAGANASYYMVRAIMTSAAKIGTEQVLKDLDNLKPGAWQAPAIKQAAEAWGQIGVKYMNKSFLGLRHTEVQLQQNQDKVAFYPCGSWLENEQAASITPNFEYAVMPYPSVTTSDQLPATAINAAAGEIYFASTKGTNVQGGKEYLRVMLSKAAALEFTKLTKSLTVVAGAADGQTISPGLTSGNDMLTKAGKDVFMGYLWDTWYKKMNDASLEAVNALMFNGGDAQKFCDTMEKVAQDVAKDPSIAKNTRA